MTEELAVIEPGAVTLFGTDEPQAIMLAARAKADALARFVRDAELVVKIGPGEHVKIEGWTFLGTMLGVYPVVVSSGPLWQGEALIGYEARAEARTRDGAVVGAAEAMCSTLERGWRGKDEYAFRSMAQTRAASKALRLPLGFVMAMAGYNPTPAEEMPLEAPESPAEPPRGFAAPRGGRGARSASPSVSERPTFSDEEQP